MSEIIFLGTGGGRVVTFLQLRGTGGVVFKLPPYQIHIDPGPGALLRAKEFRVNPRHTNVLCLTHCHMDHIDDVNVILEAMTFGKTRKHGILISNKTCLEGVEDFSPVVPTYCKKRLEKVVMLNPGDWFELENLRIEATRTQHEDPFGIGFKFVTRDFKVSYTSDTDLIPALIEDHKDSEIVILSLFRPARDKWPGHLCTEEAIQFLKEIKARVAILHHFGMKVLRASPFNEARRIARETGIRTIAATDGMKASIEDLLNL
jgi:phosphoribosyl 1,2-cyclic phosphodiesterase